MTRTSVAPLAQADSTAPTPPEQPLAERLFPREPGAAIDVAHATLAAPLRPGAEQSVLDITEFFGETSGGIRTYLLQKAAYVQARPGLRQVLVVPGAADAVTEVEGVRSYRLRGAPIPGQAPYRLMLGRRAVRRVIAHERPQVIEVGSAFTVPWLVREIARRTATPLVHFYHSNVPRLFSPAPERDGLVRQLAAQGAWGYARLLDRMFAMTVATSQFSVDELTANGIDRVARVPLGVDLATFTPLRRASRDATRLRNGLPLDRPLLGFVGRFAMEKEFPVLMEAWRQIERRTDAWLVLIGDGPQRRELEAFARGRRVTVLPFQSTRDALADLHAALDLYVAPCSVETFGLSSLESLASGTPLLAANRGGVSEQVTASGAGRLFESGAGASLAEEAITLLGMGGAALGARGRAYCEREHAWSKVFDRLFDVYRGLRPA